MIDTHVHLWDPAIGYAWLASAPPTLRRAFTTDDLSAAAAGSATSDVVLVEAGAGRADEAERLLSAAASCPLIAGVVAPFRLVEPEQSLDELDSLASGLVVGVRDSGSGPVPDDAILRSAGAALALRGFTVDVRADASMLDDISRLADAAPETWVVIDHAASPPRLSDADAWRAWRAGLEHVARRPNVAIKVSGLLTSPLTPSDLRGAADALLGIFGASRVMVGSDWPVCLTAGSYDLSLDVAAAALEVASLSERTQILELTPRSIYGIN